MSKPVVQYEREGAFISGVGGRAYIVPLNHPDHVLVLNGHPATTSEIIQYNSDTGEFETRNTRYVPVDAPE